MKWITHNNQRGDTRIQTKFLWKRKTIFGKTRWLEKASWLEKAWVTASCVTWIAVEWVDGNSKQ